MANLLPPSIKDERFEALEAIAQRLQALDLAILAIYSPGTVGESALIHLADQFNVLGLRGWNLATTEEEKRDLVGDAIKLHKTAGTAFAIRRVMALVGFPNATVLENPPLYLDGSWAIDGIEYLEGVKTYAFVVTLDPTRAPVGQDQVDLIVALIGEWKNARSHLIDLRIGDISLFSNLLLLDGTWELDGEQELDGEKNI